MSVTPLNSTLSAEEDVLADAQDALLECLHILTRLHDQPVSKEGLTAGLPLQNSLFTPQIFIRAAENQGYSARLLKRSLTGISSLVLPAVLLLKDGGACVLTSIGKDKSVEIILPETGIGKKTLSIKELKQNYTGYCLFAQPEPRPDNRDRSIEQSTVRFWFWGTLWKFKRYYADALLAASVINVLAIATSLFIMNVYDRVVPNNAVETLYVLATGVLIAIGFEFVARTLRGYFVDTAGKKADILLSSHLFSHALGIRLDSRPESAGSFASQLREFESLRDFISSATLSTLSDLPFIAFFIWIISLIGGPLYYVPLIAVPIVLTVGLIAQIPLAYVMNQHLRESALKHGLLVEAVEGTETLKALCAEGIMQGRWERYTALTGQTAVRSRFISSLMVNFTTLVQQCSTIVVVVWGVHLIGEGALTVGALIACVILTGRGLAPLGQVANLMSRYQHARAAYFMLDGLMKRPTDRSPKRNYLQRARVAGGLQFENVSFHYPEQTVDALTQVSFSIQPGEHVAILGRIGSGKSTLLKLLAGLYQAHEGSALIDGVDLRQFDPADVRRNVNYVSQDARLFYGSLKENITMGMPLADDEAVIRVARMTGLDKLIDRHPMGFDLVIAEGGEGLSGGQRQAVALARALLKPSPVFLLDEPTSSMDHSSEQHINANLRTITEKRTLILVTHKPTMLNLVDRIIVMDAGKLVMDGPRDHVLKSLTRPA